MKKSQEIPLFLLCIFLLLAGKTQAQTILLTTKWTAQAQFTGYYVAEEKGFYREMGVDVRVVHPAISESSFSKLQQKTADVAVMNLSFALTERAAGVPIINIMQSAQQNSLMLVSRIPLKGIQDLQHRKIAVWNHLSQELLEQIAKHYKLDVEWVRFNSGINVFLSRAVDICLVGNYNEYLLLRESGVKENEIHLLSFIDMGYNLPEDGLYVTEDFYNQNPESIKKIAAASRKGWEWAKEHPEEALDIVMNRIRKDNIGTNRYHQQLMLEELFRLQVNPDSQKATFLLSRKGFDMATDILLDDSKKGSIQYEDFVK